MTPRRENFVDFYVANGGNATQAYISAGYSENGAAQGAERLLRNVEVRDAIVAGRSRLTQMVELNQQWVLDRLSGIAERCLEPKPMLDRKGVPTGDWYTQDKDAIAALQLIGKHLGMFSDRLIIEDTRAAARKAALEHGLDPDAVVAEAERQLAAKK